MGSLNATSAIRLHGRSPGRCVCLVLRPLTLGLFLLSALGGLPGFARADDQKSEAAAQVSSSTKVASGAELRVRLEEKLSTRRNRKGDAFYTEMLEDVRLPGGLAIPRSTQIIGRIDHSKRAGRIAGRAEMKLAFETLQFRSGARVPIEGILVSVRASQNEMKGSSTVQVSKGESGQGRSVGVASAIGALIGSIKGGAKGAAIGAGAGAAIGLAGILGTRGRDLELDPETELVIRLVKPVELPSELLHSVP